MAERFPRLTTIILNGKFAIWDCAYIMQQFSETLETFKVQTMTQSDDSSLSVFKSTLALFQPGATARVVMVALHTLEIDSDFSPGDMLNFFSFPSLKNEFKLTIRCSKLLFFRDSRIFATKNFDSIIWSELKKTTITGDFLDSHSHIIKNKRPDGDHSHTYATMISN
ncbi:hypothetical protein DXG01_005954 [Tephrocybe rancida]|nr:hypothetical protein DXG01_005954 [Tephrocybe rancida]